MLSFLLLNFFFSMIRILSSSRFLFFSRNQLNRADRLLSCLWDVTRFATNIIADSHMAFLRAVGQSSSSQKLSFSFSAPLLPPHRCVLAQLLRRDFKRYGIQLGATRLVLVLPLLRLILKTIQIRIMLEEIFCVTVRTSPSSVTRQKMAKTTKKIGQI